MIDAKIYLDDMPVNARVEAKYVVFGRSSVEAFPSSFIKLSALVSADCAQIWVGETSDPANPHLSKEDKIEYYRGYQGGDGLCVFRSGGEHKPKIEVARASAGCCPVYVSATRDCLALSWRYEAVVANLPVVRPDIDACRLYLKEAVTHTRNQVIKDTFILWPGESLTFDTTGLEFHPIETIGVVRPTPLSNDSRASEYFLELISNVCRPLVEAAERPLVELSGGYDSSCVGVALRRIRSDLRSYGIVQEGAVGVQQHARRAELLSIVGSRDFEYPSFMASPFLSVLNDTNQHLTCMDDCYRSMCWDAIKAAPYEIPDLVISGIGGDELTKPETYRRKPGELYGNCSSSSISAAMCRHDLFLRQGIWSFNPLISQDVVDFCRGLPDKLRDERNLNVLALARAGLSDGFLFPRYAEHFGNMLQRFAYLQDFDSLFKESIVGDFGILDISDELQNARNATLMGYTHKTASDLLFIIKLEVVLRNYLGL